MLTAPFKQVDVFTRVRFKGNPVAVILDAEGLTGEQMQQIANWTHLSETTFALPPTDGAADYRVRIFTPNAELPFAGHPTLGTAHALMEAGLVAPTDGVLVQECGAGLVRIEVTTEADDTQWLSFELPQPELTPLDGAQRTELEAVLGCELMSGIDPRLVDVGPRWVVAQLPNAEAVLSLKPDLARMKAQDIEHGRTGIVAFGEYETGKEARIEVRAFAPALGVDEDPVCGSGNGSVAAFIRATGQMARFGSEVLSSQGAPMGRAGRLRLSLSEARIQVGGNAVTCIDGLLAC